MADVTYSSPANGSTLQAGTYLRFTITVDGNIEYIGAKTYINDSEVSNDIWYDVVEMTTRVSVSGNTFTYDYGTIDASISKMRFSISIQTTGSEKFKYYLDYKVIAYTACGAPTSCAVNDTLSSGENVLLSWGAGAPGIANPIAGYHVYYSDSADGVNWGAWVIYAGVGNVTSCAVAPPDAPGYYRRFMVYTIGSVEGYHSGGTVSSNALRRDHAALAGFTDPTLTAGATPVKAIHMTELHNRVNTLRAFYGLSAYAFSPIDARGIAGWTDHVNEIKAAIEGVCSASGKTHEAWITFSVNCPRADVIAQLRRVVLAL